MVKEIGNKEEEHEKTYFFLLPSTVRYEYGNSHSQGDTSQFIYACMYIHMELLFSKHFLIERAAQQETRNLVSLN